MFLDFLAQLRERYLAREEDPAFPAFRSVILAGVTDVKHLKMRIRPEGQHKPNSPWNIATDFDVDMSFSANDIAGMLTQYEADHEGIAKLEMYGFVRRGENGRVVISNRIFETRLYDLFILEDRIAGSRV